MKVGWVFMGGWGLCGGGFLGGVCGGFLVEAAGGGLGFGGVEVCEDGGFFGGGEVGGFEGGDE